MRTVNSSKKTFGEPVIAECETRVQIEDAINRVLVDLYRELNLGYAPCPLTVEQIVAWERWLVDSVCGGRC